MLLSVLLCMLWWWRACACARYRERPWACCKVRFNLIRIFGCHSRLLRQLCEHLTLLFDVSKRHCLYYTTWMFMFIYNILNYSFVLSFKLMPSQWRVLFLFFSLFLFFHRLVAAISFSFCSFNSFSSFTLSLSPHLLQSCSRYFLQYFFVYL